MQFPASRRLALRAVRARQRLLRGNVGRSLRVMIVGSILSALTAVLALAPQAASADTCVTYTHRYYLGAGSTVTLRVAYVDAVLRVCRGSAGVTNAVASQTVATTAPGNAAGFNIEAGPAVVDRMSSPVILASYKGILRICIAKVTPLCSSSSEYEITVRLGTPTIGDPNEPDWHHGPETPGGVHYYEDA